MAKKTVEKTENKTLSKAYILTVGRRKEAVARVRLYQSLSEALPFKKGDVIVNGKKIEEYFKSKTEGLKYLEAFKVTNTIGKYTFSIKVAGGGRKGQLQAVTHGISRAIASADSKNRPALKKAGLLTRDPRVRERRKVGMGGKARRKRQSPKR